MKLLLDEMLSPRLAQQLRARGHDVVAVAELPRYLSANDPAIFSFAQDDGRAVVTRNIDDFRGLMSEAIRRGGSHAGLVLVTNQAFPSGSGRLLGRLFNTLLAFLEADMDLEGREHWLR